MFPSNIEIPRAGESSDISLNRPDISDSRSALVKRLCSWLTERLRTTRGLVSGWEQAAGLSWRPAMGLRDFARTGSHRPDGGVDAPGSLGRTGRFAAWTNGPSYARIAQRGDLDARTAHQCEQRHSLVSVSRPSGPVRGLGGITGMCGERTYDEMTLAGGWWGREHVCCRSHARPSFLRAK